ncbi:MAG: methyltransferase domain-containing protein [Proteobacteria bacterium]|nr:methyltransferase domain-containing protein [Pseudomonadota bacterium]MBU1641400.1 methyltransferase domain-containing protein [Pseudomonadota bacterium]
MSPQEKAKDSIRQRFCRAAHSYDQYAHVQGEAALWLLASLAKKPAKILEIGCGTGNLTKLLAEKFPAAHIDALDFADTMVAQARQKVGNSERVRFYCEDGEAFIRTTAERYDLVVSNATLQWFHDLPGTFEHLAGILSENGRIALSLFGPGSFQELATAMREVVDPVIRLPAESFCSPRDAERFAAKVFTEVALSTRQVEREYATFFDILEHIKKTGTGGYHEKVPHLSRPVLKSLSQWFARRGRYVITYEIYILCCQGVREKGK